MSKRVMRGLMVAIIVMLAIMVGMSINTSIEAFDKKEEVNYNYHFQVIVDKSMEKANRDDLIQGCKDSSEDNGVYIEVIEAIDDEHKAEIIDKAIYSKVDGLAFNVSNQSMASKLAKKAKAMDVPIVNYGISAYNDENIVNIHMTPYNIASIMVKSVISEAKNVKLSKDDLILVLLKECDTKDKKINNRLIKGFSKGISSKYKNNVKYIRVDAEGYDVSSKLKSQINKYKKARIVVCFDDEYTNVASVLYSNKYREKISKKLTIIGYGTTNNNQDSIKEGKVKILYNVKQQSLGYNSVEALVDMKKKSDVDIKKYMPLFQKIQLNEENEMEVNDLLVVK